MGLFTGMSIISVCEIIFWIFRPSPKQKVHTTKAETQNQMTNSGTSVFLPVAVYKTPTEAAEEKIRKDMETTS